MRRLWLIGLLLLAGCTASPKHMLGDPRAEVLAEVDVSDISADRGMAFGKGDVAMYSNFGQFAEDKLAMGGDWTPDWRNWSDELKGRAEVRFTTVQERTAEARAAGEGSTATVWYFWDENDCLLAILRETWQ